MSAQDRGWGPGWPNCPTHHMKSLRWITGSVHEDVHELIDTLCEATVKRGYGIRKDWSWGFACRAIRGSNRPSNHSWGLAVDINAPNNPMRSTLRTDMPRWMADMWEDCGFRWGGRYSGRKDPMHYEYMGRPEDVAGHLNKARRYLAEADGRQYSAQSGKVTSVEEEDVISKDENSRGAHVTVLCWRLNQVFHRGDHDPEGGGVTVKSVVDDEVHAYIVHFQSKCGYPKDGRLKWWENDRLEFLAAEELRKRREREAAA